MPLTKLATDILQGTSNAVKEVLPFELSIEQPSLLTQPYTQHCVGVLIGMTGDVRGRLIIDGSEKTFGKIGEGMFGMMVEGEMLESFAGELGNMIAGTLSTFISQQGLEMDITPPTVLVGQTKIYGFDKAYRLPITVQGAGTVIILLMIEQELER
ncbi:chemotaxis protein CheX [Niallia endozanthoxylica]|uniref:Chemotaxis protein CheX n=1 Tax=Niallia endozanthoxylica TaxID=2036016 RepID=A0A5J5HU69_9BACI|nr:chemotaxis protein CheX [Niallia endozanthoxylica]KAA9026076.1 chemotaxis protein CheX [Niallia endozanthoxylica]